MDDHGARLWLLCRVSTRLCALPLEYVVETMRPLPVESMAGTPDFVPGVAIIRGTPVPVVSAARLLGSNDSHPSRFVTVKAGERHIALVVDSVLGVRPLAEDSLRELPPLLRDIGAETVSTIGALDATLLLVLRGTRILPDVILDNLDAQRASA